MSTEIKAIQCPKCGSTEKTELRLDHFRCDSCGTEYFLDSDSAAKAASKPGIVDPRRAPQTAVGKSSTMGCFITIILVVVVVGVALIFGVATSHTHTHYSNTNASGTSGLAPTWQYTNSWVYLSADGKPIIVGAGYYSRYLSTGWTREPYV